MRCCVALYPRVRWTAWVRGLPRVVCGGCLPVPDGPGLLLAGLLRLAPCRDAAAGCEVLAGCGHSAERIAALVVCGLIVATLLLLGVGPVVRAGHAVRAQRTWRESLARADAEDGPM